MRRLTGKLRALRRVCVREKGHLVVGGGYLVTTALGHNSAIMATVYGVAALMATHVINRTGAEQPDLRHRPRHLADN